MDNKFESMDNKFESMNTKSDDESKINYVIEKVTNEYNRAKENLDLINLGYSFIGITSVPERLKVYPSVVIVDLEINLFQGAKHKIEIFFPQKYPFAPPRVVFSPPIKHRQVSQATGALMSDIVGYNWTPACVLRVLLLSIIQLFDI
ncbi:Ubiquitin-conjugating enzyme E2 [uncultured virus]|nr:Ubiquitin-conjugating enzyme E2 [uncultured virus]